MSALVRSDPSPSAIASLEEQREILATALEELSETDREILLLKHFEQLSTAEVAAVLEFSHNGASIRHVTALRRLQFVLARAGLRFGPDEVVRPIARSTGEGGAS